MDAAITGIIIALVLGLVLVGAGYCAYRNIRNKVKEFSRMAFGTDSIKEGFEQVEEEYASTPKSVAAGTSLYLPRIRKDFPEFHYDEMKNRAENVLMSYLRSIDEDNEALLTEGTGELKDKLGMQIGMLRGENVRAHYKSMKIHRTEICQYRKQQGRCSVIFQSSIEYYFFKEKDGRIKEGNKNIKTQARYNVECLYIQDRDYVENIEDAGLAMNCPNCGAPLSRLGAKVCEYCGTPVLEFNIRIWNFSDVEET